mmetsp:Transcript_50541/g.94157  ORF Transcript_50541/g.94157 Transcript_50541/m.94157 type:complete len:214 (+) Transcript_50541:167-808(+)
MHPRGHSQTPWGVAFQPAAPPNRHSLGRCCKSTSARPPPAHDQSAQLLGQTSPPQAREMSHPLEHAGGCSHSTLPRSPPDPWTSGAPCRSLVWVHQDAQPRASRLHTLPSWEPSTLRPSGVVSIASKPPSLAQTLPSCSVSGQRRTEHPVAQQADCPLQNIPKPRLLLEYFAQYLQTYWLRGIPVCSLLQKACGKHFEHRMWSPHTLYIDPVR